jgi:hypothetical protein
MEFRHQNGFASSPSWSQEKPISVTPNSRQIVCYLLPLVFLAYKVVVAPGPAMNPDPR